MDYRTTIALKGFFKDAFSQVLEEMPQGRQDVVAQLMSNQHLEDGTLLLDLMGSNKQEKPLLLDMLGVALNGAIEMAKAEEDGQELKRLAKYQQTLLLFKNTNLWDTSIVDAADDEAAAAEQ